MKNLVFLAYRITAHTGLFLSLTAWLIGVCGTLTHATRFCDSDIVLIIYRDGIIATELGTADVESDLILNARNEAPSDSLTRRQKAPLLSVITPQRGLFFLHHGSKQIGFRHHALTLCFSLLTLIRRRLSPSEGNCDADWAA